MTQAQTTPNLVGLKDLLKGMFSKEEVKAWSQAKVFAWKNRKKNPNAFYYRFVDPGIDQCNGSWTSHEHHLFLQRLTEFRRLGFEINTCWGIFSLKIPGRVSFLLNLDYPTISTR